MRQNLIFPRRLFRYLLVIMKHIWKSFIVALLIVVAAQTVVRSQSLSLPTDGKDFFVGFMYPSYNKVGNSSTDGFYGAYILVSSYTDNHVTVSYFDRQTGVEVQGRRYTIPARTGIQIQLDLSQVKMADSGDVPEFAACHVTADRAINVQFFSTGACSGGSFLPITTAALGKRYVIQSYGNNPGNLGLQGGFLGPRELEVSHGFFEIIAPFDGTTVKIIPNSTTLGGHSGFHSGKGSTFPTEPAYFVGLRRGQCYLVKSASDEEDDDISGSIVESDKPIAVIAGHENAALGGVSNRSLEGRDFMVEQMYPYNMWDTTGYVMVPLIDSRPPDPNQYEGTGENYRVFSYDTIGSTINFFDLCVSGPIAMTAGRLQQPPPERFGVLCPIDIESTNGKKFTAMMYDQRNFATAAPYPGPSMISVVPISRWRTSFLWYVPANKFETLQGYYVNILCQKGDLDGAIKGSFNGGVIRPIKQVIAPQTAFNSIPNYPNLMGQRFQLGPGSYYAVGPRPFMVYNYGFRALDPNFDLGDLDGDDFFFSYGLPVGMKIGGEPHIRVMVDTFCSYWNVCVHDSTFGLYNQGIKSVTLLEDSTGDILKPGYIFRNTRLDDSLDPDRTNEINFTGDDSDVCFKVLVNNPLDSAYAPLFIVDDQGGAILVQLKYKAPLFKITPSSGKFLKVPLPSDSCSRFVFYNIGDTKHQKGDTTKAGKDSIVHRGAPFDIAFVKLQLGKNFRILSIVPPLPTSIKPGDSLVITACFTVVADTSTKRDTILFGNYDCLPLPIDLIGKPAIPIIVAGNRDFGSIIVDSTKCDTVSVRNIGDAPFTLTTQWVLHNYFNFEFKDSSLLPMVLLPGQVVYLHFCYTPYAERTDTTVQNWGTTLNEPYKHTKKDTSILIGVGVKSGFIWDRVIQEQTVICDDTNIVRVYLKNNNAPGGPAAHVDSVRFAGPDKSEFYILANQRYSGSGVFGNFDLKAGDSIWVDVVFKANLAKPIPAKYDDRHADLVASDSVNDVAIQKDQKIGFTGHVLYATPNLAPTYLEYGIVALGKKNTHSFYLTDTGTAPLIVESITPITSPVIGVGLAPGDTIFPGQTNGKIVTVDMVLNNYTDTTVILYVTYKTSCPQTIPETLHIAASYINPTNTGHPYTPTFLNCRNQLDSIQAINVGTTNLTLRQIDIINQVPAGTPQFSFVSGPTPQTLVVNKVYRPGTRLFYPILYAPTIEGPVSATVQVTWDSLGTDGKLKRTILSTNILSGIGRVERDTLTPVITTPSQAPNWTTGSGIDVQVNFGGFWRDSIVNGNILTNPEAVPADIQAMGMTFSVTYRRDLLNYNVSSVKFDPSLSLIGSNPIPVSDGNGNETVTFVLQSNTGPITKKMTAATLQFQIMVAKDYSTPIAVSNAYYWGANPSDSLCYVITALGTTPFAPNPTCGDSVLRHYLYGFLPTKIISVTPNPSTEGRVPIVTYDVKVAKIPLTIELYDALGERIRIIEKNVPHEVGQYILPLGVKSLPSGMYVLRITTPNSIESHDFIIQK